MRKKFIERIGAEPSSHPHYIFKGLNRSERFTIKLVYWKNWRKLVKDGGLSKNQECFFKLYFYELHARYYLTVVKGGGYVTASRLIRNFFLSKANESLRAILGSISPYNLTIFVNGIRSQIELNALLNKFIKDPAYHESHLFLNEDRKRVKELKTTINVNTLVDGLGSDLLPYQEIYDSLSLLLHPNPSAIKFYAQAEGSPSLDGTGLLSPKIKRYFDKTVSETEQISEWFSDHVWLFLTCIEHFLILFDALKHEFYANDEKRQHNQIAMAAFVKVHEKEILRAVNKASHEGGISKRQSTR